MGYSPWGCKEWDMTERLINSNNYFGPGPSLSMVNIKKEGQKEGKQSRKGCLSMGRGHISAVPISRDGLPSSRHVPPRKGLVTPVLATRLQDTVCQGLLEFLYLSVCN